MIKIKIKDLELLRTQWCLLHGRARQLFAINPYQSVIDTLAQFRTKLKDGTLKGIIASNDKSTIDTFRIYIMNLDNNFTLKNCDMERASLLNELNDNATKYDYNAIKIASLIGLINAFIARLNALSIGGKKRRSKRHKKRHKKRNRKTFKRKY